MAADATAGYECAWKPPHHFAIAQRVRNRNGILLTMKRLDAPYPLRDIFITNREMQMGYEDVYKPCYVCVDQGNKEIAVAIPKADIEAGLPPA